VKPNGNAGDVGQDFEGLPVEAVDNSGKAGFKRKSIVGERMSRVCWCDKGGADFLIIYRFVSCACISL
jgi:hypothetical protein